MNQGNKLTSSLASTQFIDKVVDLLYDAIGNMSNASNHSLCVIILNEMLL